MISPWRHSLFTAEAMRQTSDVYLFALSPPRSTVFDLVLILHVGAVVISVVTVGALYAATMPLNKVGATWPSSSVRFFGSAHEVAARSLYLIPLTGFLLLGVSQGHYDVSNGFVVAGLVLWVLAMMLGEGLVFPRRNRIHRMLQLDVDGDRLKEVARDAGALRWGVDGVLLLVVAGVVVMVAQP
jgi:hypothetical protein